MSREQFGPSDARKVLKPVEGDLELHVVTAVLDKMFNQNKIERDIINRKKWYRAPMVKILAMAWNKKGLAGLTPEEASV